MVEAIYCGCFPLLPTRLSYPELIPPQYHSTCLYEDFDDLVERLYSVLSNPNLADLNDLPAAVSRFDWGKMAPAYDQHLDLLVDCCASAP